MDEIENEIWRPVVGWEESYEVSNFGRIKGIRVAVQHRQSRIKKLSTNPSGYLQTTLYFKGEEKWTPVHILVAEAFIGPRQNGMQINHKDGNKKNNYIDNLEYVTPRENTRHAYNLGLCGNKKLKPVRIVRENQNGELNSMAKLTEKQVLEIRNLIDAGMTTRNIGKLFNVSGKTISYIGMRKTWKHVG